MVIVVFASAAKWIAFLAIVVSIFWTLLFFMAVGWVILQLVLKSLHTKIFYRHFSVEEILDELSIFSWKNEEEVISGLTENTELSWYKVGFYTKDVRLILAFLSEYGFVEERTSTSSTNGVIVVSLPEYRKTKSTRNRRKETKKEFALDFSPLPLPSFAS